MKSQKPFISKNPLKEFLIKLPIALVIVFGGVYYFTGAHENKATYINSKDELVKVPIPQDRITIINNEERAKVENLLKKETQIKWYDWSQKGDKLRIHIGMESDGSPKYGYASYVCNLIWNERYRKQTVVYTHSHHFDKKSATLGRYQCDKDNHQNYESGFMVDPY